MTLIVFLLFLVPIDCATYEDEQRLRNTLFENYSTEIRPVLQLNTTARIAFNYYLISVEELDEISGICTVLSGLEFRWRDEKLQWKPKHHGGITYLLLQEKNLWVPPVSLVNSAGDLKVFGELASPFQVTYRGYISINFGKVLRSTCEVDMTYFPFDTQICRIVFAPLGCDEKDVYLYPLVEKVHMSHFIPSSQWNVITYNLNDHWVHVPKIRGLVEVELWLKRKPVYYILNILMPILLLTILNPLVFILPVEGGERLSYTVTIFLSFAVFMTLINDIIPRSSEHMSRFSYLLVATLSYSSVICIVNMIIISLRYKPESCGVPIWLQKVLLLHYRNSKSNDDMNENNSLRNKSGVKEIKCRDVTWETVANRFDFAFLMMSFIFVIIEAILLIVYIVLN